MTSMEAVAILFTIFVLPLLIIMHYMTKWKAARGLSVEEERLLEELCRDSERIAGRLHVLETILDDEVPDWRRKV